VVVDDLGVGYYYRHRRRHRRRPVTPLVSYYSWFEVWFDTLVVFHLNLMVN